jgi:hypothetical protein
MRLRIAVLLVAAFGVALAQFGGGTVSLPPGTLVPISSVISLATELAARPIKAGTFTTSRAVYINSSGQLQSVSGGTTDCVLVNGTSATCGIGGSAGTAVPAEQPSGSSVTYTIANTPISGSLLVYVNGQFVLPGGVDYTLSGTTLTFVAGYSSWLTAGQIRVSYRY